MTNSYFRFQKRARLWNIMANDFESLVFMERLNAFILNTEYENDISEESGWAMERH